MGGGTTKHVGKNGIVLDDKSFDIITKNVEDLSGTRSKTPTNKV